MSLSLYLFLPAVSLHKASVTCLLCIHIVPRWADTLTPRALQELSGSSLRPSSQHAVTATARFSALPSPQAHLSCCCPTFFCFSSSEGWSLDGRHRRGPGKIYTYAHSLTMWCRSVFKKTYEHSRLFLPKETRSQLRNQLEHCFWILLETAFVLPGYAECITAGGNSSMFYLKVLSMCVSDPFWECF